MKVYFYKTSQGNSPIEKYIDKLPQADQARFLEIIKEIEERGLSAARLIFKPLEGKLWEIKFKVKSVGYRVLYVILEEDLMVWLHAFSKKTQKTPKKELDLARKRIKEVLK